MKLIKPSNFKLSDSEGNGWKRKTTPEYDISIGRHTHTHTKEGRTAVLKPHILMTFITMGIGRVGKVIAASNIKELKYIQHYKAFTR